MKQKIIKDNCNHYPKMETFNKVVCWHCGVELDRKTLTPIKNGKEQETKRNNPA